MQAVLPQAQPRLHVPESLRTYSCFGIFLGTIKSFLQIPENICKGTPGDLISFALSFKI